MMKLLITALGLAIIASACQNEFASAQKLSEKDEVFEQTFSSGTDGKAKSFTLNTSNYIFTHTEKRNLIVSQENNFATKDNAPVAGSHGVKASEEMVFNNGRKQPDNYNLFPEADFLLVSLLIVN